MRVRKYVVEIVCLQGLVSYILDLGCERLGHRTRKENYLLFGKASSKWQSHADKEKTFQPLWLRESCLSEETRRIVE